MRFKVFLIIGVIFILSSVIALAALDLQFTTAISQSPDPASAGGSVTFTVAFKTFGGAVTNLKIIGGDDGADIFERTYAGIAADKVRTDTFTWTATAGSHTAWFELDPDHTCGDSDYSNNRVEKALTVGGGPAGQPDLVPVVTYNPATFAAGNTVTFSIRVNNNGTAPSNACQMTVKREGATIQTINLAAIPAGNHLDKSYAWAAECGTPLIVIKADSNNANTESNEDNNIWSHWMACGGGPAGQPDLAPVVTYAPTNFAAGDVVIFTIRVNNNGTAASVASQVQVKKGATVLHTGNIAAIAVVGGHLNDTYNWTAECDTALTISVDSSNTNTESNEGNNTWSHTMACNARYLHSLEYWLIYKSIEFAPFPPPCLGCPPWHDLPKPGDPIDILTKIGDKLGQGEGFEGVKGDWARFLRNNHGLNPNAALKIIFDRAVLGAKGKIQTEGAALQFQNGLNNTLGQLHGFALNKFANELQIQ